MHLPIPSISLLNISVNFSELYILSLENGTFKAKSEFAIGFEAAKLLLSFSEAHEAGID